MPRKNKNTESDKVLFDDRISKTTNKITDKVIDKKVDDIIDDIDTESENYDQVEQPNELMDVIDQVDNVNDLIDDNAQSNIDAVKNYTAYEKEVMVKRISRLQIDEHRIIRNIIKKYEPDKKKKKVAGGSYISFHNLSNQVYFEIEQYLEQISRKNKEEFQKYMSETENVYYSAEDQESSDIDSNKARYRLSNREKHMVNRQRFDKIRSEEIQESIRMNQKKRKDRKIDLTSSDKRINKTINIGTSDINSVFDSLSYSEKGSDRPVSGGKRSRTTTRSKKEKNIFSKNK